MSQREVAHWNAMEMRRRVWCPKLTNYNEGKETGVWKSKHHNLGIWYLIIEILNIWNLILEVWNFKPFGIWNLIIGILKHLEFGIWSLEFHNYNEGKERGVWKSKHHNLGIWNLVLEVWNLVLEYWNLKLLEFGVYKLPDFCLILVLVYSFWWILFWV